MINKAHQFELATLQPDQIITKPPTEKVFIYSKPSIKQRLLLFNLIKIILLMDIPKSAFFHKQSLKQIFHSVNICRSQYNSSFFMLKRQIIEEDYKPLKIILKQRKIKYQMLEKAQHLFSKHFGIPDQDLFLNEQRENWERVSNNTLKYVNDFLISQFNKQNSELPPQSINKPACVLFQDFKINSLENEQVILADVKVLKNKATLAKLVCQLMNKSRFGAAAFIGLGSDYRVKGTEIQQKQKDQIRKQLSKIRRSSIFPTSDQKNQELFGVEFIKVKAFGVHTTTENRKFVVKIFANTNGSNKTYFMKQQEGNNKYKYTFVDNYITQKGPDPSLWMEKIHSKFMLKRGILQFSKMAFLYKITKAEQSKLLGLTIPKIKQKKKHNFGKEPQKRFQNESIMIISDNQGGQKLFKEFLNNIGDEKKFLHYHEVYEKLPKVLTNRKVYYMSHNKKPDELGNVVLKMDPERWNIILLKVKPQLSMLRNETFGKALDVLCPRLKDFTDQKLEVVWKITNFGNIQYFMKFQSTETAIFANVLLQYNDIRTNFANPKKLQKSFHVKYMKNYEHPGKHSVKEELEKMYFKIESHLNKFQD